MSFTHEFTWHVDADRQRVWSALTEPSQLTRWFAEHARVDGREGGSYGFWGKHTLGMPGETTAPTVITAWVPDERLAYDWELMGTPTSVTLVVAAGDSASEGAREGGDATAPTEEGSSRPSTKIELRHVVHGELPVTRVREMIDDHWRLVLGNLTQFLSGSEFELPDYSATSPEVRFTVHLDAPPATVFRALVEPALVNQWFQSKKSRIEPRVGGEYNLGWEYKIDDRDVVGGPTTILEFVPDRRLALDWRDWRGDDTVTGQTITFDLQPSGEGTTLTFVHAGFQRVVDISDYGFGWQWFLGELAKVARAEAEGR